MTTRQTAGILIFERQCGHLLKRYRADYSLIIVVMRHDKLNIEQSLNYLS